MKQFVLLTILSVGAIAFAKPQKSAGVLEFEIKSAQYAQSHVQDALNGQITLNYTEKKVNLYVREKSKCPSNMFCAQVVKALSVELPITSIETDDCGVRHVTALKDERPVDGIMQKITVSDPTKMTCRTFAPVFPKATYETAFVDRLKGKTVKAVSTMDLVLAGTVSPQSEVLLKYQMHVGFSPDPQTIILTIDNKGEVLSKISYMRTKKVTRLEIAQLSSKVVENLKKQVASVPEDTKLISEDPNAPICMDAPTSKIFAIVDGNEVQIYENSGCRVSKSYDGEAASLSAAVLGLTYLAK